MNMCYHPWVGLDISPQGEIKPCCKYLETIARNLDDYQASGTLATIREQFLKGERPPGCARCWKDEDAGLKSKRQLDNEFVFNNDKPSLDTIKVLSLPFGNTCNLACRICSSYSSSKWSTEAKKIKQHLPNIQVIKPAKFHKNKNFMQSIKDITHNVIHVEIPGGEPFYADREIHLDFLNHLCNHNPEDITLHYITNGTIFPDSVLFEAWQKFKKVDIQISIDGTENKFEYNRWPADWTAVKSNIQKYLEVQRSNIQISVSHSVSIFTLYELPDFLKWCQQIGLPQPYLGLVSRPLHYSITVLPDGAKQAITERFGNNTILAPIVKELWSQDNSNQLDNFIKYVKILDRQRSQSFNSVFPELYQLLGEQCQTLYQRY